MSKPSLVLPALLMLLTGLLASCESPEGGAQTARPRFHESAAVDVAFQFSGWNAIYLLRPDSREDGFYPVYMREDVASEIKRRRLGRSFAAVVIGNPWIFSADIQRQCVDEWTTLLRKEGYQRVVFLLGGDSPYLDGLPIVDEVTLTVARE